MDKILDIHVFGSFYVSYGDKTLHFSSMRSKKLSTLFKYLLLNKSRKISQAQLIEAIYPGKDYDNPLNTLKALVFRLRKVVSTLGIDGSQVIISVGDSYAFNTDIAHTLDVENFCELYEKYKDEPDEGLRLDGLMRAADALSFDAGDNEPNYWIETDLLYYKSLLFKAFGQIVKLLKKRGDYEKIVQLCRRAGNTFQDEEDLHYYHIQSLSSMGRFQDAAKQYFLSRDLLFNRFDALPGRGLANLPYQGIGADNDICEIRSMLHEKANYSGCYYCDCDAFKNIYRAISRHVHICEKSFFLASFRLSNKNEETARALGEILAFTLKSEDILTRYNSTLYLAIITSLQTEKQVLDFCISIQKKLYRISYEFCEVASSVRKPEEITDK